MPTPKPLETDAEEVESDQIRSYGGGQTPDSYSGREKAIDLYVRQQERWSCIIDPELSKGLRFWDVCSSVLLVYVCFVSPYEVAFITDGKDIIFLRNGADALFWINRVVDAAFVVDMILQFFIKYPVKRRFGTTYISDHRQIAKHYLRTWFIIDFLSILPYDLVGMMVESDAVARLKLLRVVRLLRLLKLARLLRGLRILKRWELEISFSYRKMTLLQLAITVCITGHWISCILGIMTNLQGDACQGPGATYPPDDCVETWLSAVYAVEEEKLDSFATYLVALHTAATIIVHPHDLKPTNTAERACFVFLLLWGGFTWTRVISRSTAIRTSMDQHNVYYHQTMDELNAAADRYNLPPGLRRKLRAFFIRSTRATWQRRSFGDILSRMSPALQTEVSFQVNRTWLRQVRYLKTASRLFVWKLSTLIEPLYLAQEETFGCNFTLYILNRGLCTKGIDKVVVLHPGAVWGEDHMLLNAWWLLSPNTACALSYAEVMSLTRESFKRVCDEYAGEVAPIRKHFVWLVVTRGIVYEAKRRKAQMAGGERAEGSRRWSKSVSKASSDELKDEEHDYSHRTAFHTNAQEDLRNRGRALLSSSSNLSMPDISGQDAGQRSPGHGGDDTPGGSAVLGPLEAPIRRAISMEPLQELEQRLVAHCDVRADRIESRLLGLERLLLAHTGRLESLLLGRPLDVDLGAVALAESSGGGGPPGARPGEAPPPHLQRHGGLVDGPGGLYLLPQAPGDPLALPVSRV